VAGDERPAFYALRPGGWRDYVTLLHPPYTAWHLSYVALGAAAAPHLDGGRLGASVLAFFCAVGLSAHALDELAGRPLATRHRTRDATWIRRTKGRRIASYRLPTSSREPPASSVARSTRTSTSAS
jgi:hypothetical protein